MGLAKALDELFQVNDKNDKGAGYTKTILFARFYEKLLCQYFKQQEGYDIHDSYKPRILWNEVSLLKNLPENPQWEKLSKELQRKQTTSHCTPDGLFKKDEKYFIWEAKNWIWEKGEEPFEGHLHKFPWLLADKCHFKGEEITIDGFIISWWDDCNIDEIKTDFKKIRPNKTLELRSTKKIVHDCISNRYSWYLDLVKKEHKNIEKFFNVLLGEY